MTGQRRRRGTVPAIAMCLAFAGIILLREAAVRAEPPGANVPAAEGFRGLRWGTTVDDAMRRYADLHLERYALSGGARAPWKVYRRQSEVRDVEGVSFDRVEYWFRGDRLVQVQAILRSSIGPRTLQSMAESAYETIDGRLRNRYGAPAAARTNYVTEFLVIVREDSWNVGGTGFTLRYEGAGAANEDTVTLTMRERGK